MAHEAGLAQSPWGGAPPSPGNTSYLHGNLVGTTERMTDGSGAVARRAVYTAFGDPVYEDGTANTRYGYVGAWGYQEAGSGDPLADLGWLHVGARYYDPSSGRFVQRDPIGIEGGMNVYTYVDNYPVSEIDPEGFCNPRWWQQKRGPDGRFGPKRIWFKKVHWLVRPYLLGKLVARAGHWLIGAPYEDPEWVAWDIAKNLYREWEGEENNRRQRAQHREIWPPPPPGPPPPPWREKLPIGCFVEGTTVETDEGPVPIETLEIQDCVMTEDPSSGERELAPVLAVHSSYRREIVQLFFENEVIACSPEHPFFVKGKGWIEAGNLAAGYLLRDADGREVVLEAATYEISDHPTKVFNLTVDGHSTFFVGHRRVLVHNKII